MRNRPTRSEVRARFSTADYTRGDTYYRQGLVHHYREAASGAILEIDCQVNGTREYGVHIRCGDRGLWHSCSCPQHALTGSCKHVVAALLTCAEMGDRESDAQWLLKHYARAMEPGAGNVRLVPRIHCYQGMKDYPTVTFQIGVQKLYVLRNVQEFLHDLGMERTVTYGKQLTLRHSLGEFDETSRQLIDLLKTTAALPGYNWNAVGKNEVRFRGDTFDRFFDLYQGQELEMQQKRETIRLDDSDPMVTMRLQPVEHSVRLDLHRLNWLSFFGVGRFLYAMDGDTLHRCSQGFAERMEPFLELRQNQLWFTREEIPEFCACVLPAVREHIQLEDPDGVVERYAPDPCTPCYYFDMDGGRLTGRLTLRYGDTELPWGQELQAGTGVNRDTRAERQARKLLTDRFCQEETGQCYLEHDDAIFTFLSETIQDFRKFGEVYVSDRLQNRQFRPAAVSVGVSVADGLLKLEMDTGGFPAEELESLYRAMLQRRKFYRLRDGRFLALEDSRCETLAEAVHMLQLGPKELQKGVVSLPAFRAPYLEGVMGNGLLRRDKSFRDMVKRFENLEDSGFMVPETMDGVLRPYQVTGFRWLKTLESCGFGGILADEMGLGKTLQMIAFLTTVPRSKVGLPSLIVCPASLVLNWADEFARFAPQCKVNLILGTAAQRRELIEEDEDSDVWVTSYDLLKRDGESYANQKFYCCALDEGQFIKNQATKASRAVKAVDCRQRFVLTGTPIENRLSELWNLFDFLMPGYLFTHSRFLEKLERPIVQAEDREAQTRLQKLVQPFLLRRLKQDVLRELPPKIEHVRRIGLSQEERKLYLASTAAAKGAFAGGEKMQILAALTRLRQICCHPDLCFENYVGPASKLEACVELCGGMAENGHQILLFSQFTSMLDRIRARLDEAGISSFTLQGSTPREKRAELVKRFNAGGAQVFLISLKAGGTGLNLTAADVVIHYDPWWNLAAQNQATDRAHRMGQRSCVQVYKLIAQDSIEERILELQAQKAQLLDGITAEDGSSILQMSPEDLMALLD